MRKKVSKRYKAVEANVQYCIYKNIHAIGEVIGRNITNTYLEVRIENRRVDIICQTSEGTLLLLEVSVRNDATEDFNNHNQQIAKIVSIIGKNRFADIVLIAPEFLDENINEIMDLISDYNLVVHFICLPINIINSVKELVSNSQTLKSISKVWNSDKFVLYNHIRIQSARIDTNKAYKLPLDGEHKGAPILKDILFALREVLDNNMGIFKYKDLSRNKITIGTGTSDVVLNIFYFEKNIKVEIDFGKRANIYQVFTNNIADISRYIEYPFIVHPNRYVIISNFPILGEYSNTVASVVKVVNKYMEYFRLIYQRTEL